MTKPQLILWLSDSRGVFIPRDFANSFADRAKNVTGVKPEEWLVLEAGPEQDCYWDVWQEVEMNAIVTDDKGIQYRLHQDGDLWLVPQGMEWDDETETYKWPEGGSASD